MLELQRRQDDLRAEAGFLARLTPPEAPGDHQVNHEDQRVGIGERPEGERYALTNARDLVHGRARQPVHGRIDRPQDERAQQTDLVEPAADDVCGQRFYVHCDIRKFRHRPSVAQRIGSRGRLPDVLRPCGFSRWRSRSC